MRTRGRHAHEPERAHRRAPLARRDTARPGKGPETPGGPQPSAMAPPARPAPAGGRERRLRSVLRRARMLVGPPTSVMSIMTLLVFLIVMASPAGTAADSTAPVMTASTPLSGTSFSGVPAVGALFVPGTAGSPTHFCSASVVHSPRRNMVITAAHCLASYMASPRQVTFIPGYKDGQAPYGVWTTARVIVDNAWMTAADPDHDVAFLIVTGSPAGTRIEDVTGAEQLGAGRPAGVVRVIGYPNSGGRPIACQNQATVFSARQLRFDCGGFTNGTSGGPFLADVSPATGNGLVVGVIGGYEEGGYTPAVSYSAIFGDDVAALYRSAVAES
jgi:V8-like Glu-specific endopeptidase